MNILTRRGNRSQGKINVCVYMVSCLPVIFKAEEPPAGETETKIHMLLSYKMQDRNKVCEKKIFLTACL